jgi:WD repeat-containing protein 61
MKLAGLKSIENAHDESVWAATWIPATETRPALLMTGSLDETVKLWKPDELTLERTNTGHCLGVVSVAAHPSGSIAASASLDSFVRVFDVDSNASIATLEAPPSEVWQMKFDPKVILFLFLLIFIFIFKFLYICTVEMRWPGLYKKNSIFWRILLIR